MSFLFNDPTITDLVSILKKKMTLNRDEYWTEYVNAISSTYQKCSQEKLEAGMMSANKKYMFEKGPQKFFLLKLTREACKASQLQENYGYLLDPITNRVYLTIPLDPIKFELIKDTNAESIIRTLILKKNDVKREASWEEMDSILEAFYTDKHENLEPFELKKSIRSFGDGKFRPVDHASNAYKFKREIFNCFSAQLVIEKKFRIIAKMDNLNPAQENANILLNLSWFARAKENFSWSPLADGIAGNNSRGDQTLNAGKTLGKHNNQCNRIRDLEYALAEKNLDLAQIKEMLTQFKDDFASDQQNIFSDLILAIGGVVGAPVAILIGFIWLLPAYCLDLPYFGKPLFFLDAIQWFIDSLIRTLECIIFPIAMIRAYNKTGSMNVLKGDCTRIVETLLARVDKLSEPDFKDANLLTHFDNVNGFDFLP